MDLRHIGGVASHSKCFGDLGSTSRDTIESSLQGGEQDFLVSDSELRNLRGGSSRRENERPTPTRKSNFRKAQIDFLPSPLGEGKKKAAFTLAEVLITLGIIGVVAAMTLPTLIANYQKHVWVNQLKKSVSVLSQGFTTMMGHDGVTELENTYAFSGMTGSSTGFASVIPNNIELSACDPRNILTNDCRSIKEGLESVFSGIKFTPCGESQVIKYLNGSNATSKYARNSNYTCIEFPDGSEIFSYVFWTPTAMRNTSTADKDYSYIKLYGQMNIDINGAKNPNTWGRDVFLLYINRSGTAIGSGSQALCRDNSRKSTPYVCGNHWSKDTANDFIRCTSTNVLGMGCTGRVLEEDAMNY